MTSEISAQGEIVSGAPATLELRSVSTADLRAQLSEAIGMTETAIVRVATIWAELTRRGEDLSDVRFSLARFMLPVARGQLLPGLVVALSGQARALARVAELGLDDQERLARGEAVDVYRGSRMERATLSDLTYSEIATVIRNGRILTAEEQRVAWARAQAATPKRRGGGARIPSVSVGPGGMVRIGQLTVPADRIIAELRAAGLI